MVSVCMFNQPLHRVLFKDGLPTQLLSALTPCILITGGWVGTSFHQSRTKRMLLLRMTGRNMWPHVIYFTNWPPLRLRQDPLEAILVIFGCRALIFFLFESSWKKMKNDTTFVRMRSSDHLGDAKMSKKGTSLRQI